MSANSKIEWTDHTFNPWEGCQHAGPGCDFCYAEARNLRYAPKGSTAAPNWGPGTPRRRTSLANWQNPLAWQRAAPAFLAAHGRRQRVFCASLADVFDNAAPDEWRADLAALILATPDLDWLLLTKLIGNAIDMFPAMFPDRFPVNIRIGATIVNNAEWLRDFQKIRRVRVITRTKLFLSCEPLLGDINLDAFGMQWAEIIGQVIVGGESGPGARPMHPDWARSVRDQCAVEGVPFFFKQWGEWALGIDKGNGERRFLGEGKAQFVMQRIGKHHTGRLLDGIEHNGMPS